MSWTRTVMIDLDGVLADLGAYEYVLRQEGKPSRQKWREFFSHASEAALLKSGADLVSRLERVGYRYIVSTTRPAWTWTLTEKWLHSQPHLAPPIGLYTRRRKAPGDSSPANCKREHFRQAELIARMKIVTHLFIDDEPEIVAELVENRVPAILAAELQTVSTHALKQFLTDHRRVTSRLQKSA